MQADSCMSCTSLARSASLRCVGGSELDGQGHRYVWSVFAGHALKARVLWTFNTTYKSACLCMGTVLFMGIINAAVFNYATFSLS